MLSELAAKCCTYRSDVTVVSVQPSEFLVKNNKGVRRIRHALRTDTLIRRLSTNGADDRTEVLENRQFLFVSQLTDWIV